MLGRVSNAKIQQHHTYLCLQFKTTNTFRGSTEMSVNDPFQKNHLDSLQKSLKHRSLGNP